jgi:hypothetical protein
MIYFIKNLWQRLKGSYDYYKSIEFLPVQNFFWIIEKQDLRYLLKLKDYEKLPEIQYSLEEIWEDILNQYYDAEGDNAINLYFNNIKALHRLEIQHQLFWNLHTILSVDSENRKANEIADENGIEKKDRIKVLWKLCKNLKTKKQLKQKDIENIDQNEEKHNFDEIIDIVEDMKGRPLDLSKITVKKWIAIKSNLKEKAKQAKKAAGQWPTE